MNLRLNEVVLAGNRATDGNGGAIYFGGDLLDIDRSSFTNNEAIEVENGGNGGAIYHRAGRMNIADSAFTGNLASADGGAIATGADSVVATGSTFSDNRAPSGNGGAFYVDFGGELTAMNCTITGNTAQDGSAIYNSGKPGRNR